MESIEDSHWIDMIIDKIGFALTKVDESIQKSIELWKELTKDIYDDQPTHNTTGQPNNGKSGEEDSSQDKSVAEVKERPIQHWAMCLGEVKEIPSQHCAMCLGEAKESPSQHWAMRASKIPPSLIQEQGDDDYCENVCDDDDYYNEEKEKEEEEMVDEEDETTVSDSSEDMWEINLGTSTPSYRPNSNHHHNEEAGVSLMQFFHIFISTLTKEAGVSSLMWKDGYELLNDVDTPSEEEDESWDDDYDDEEEGEEEEEEEEEKEEETTVSESCEKMSELNSETSATSCIPSWNWNHHRNEEDNGSSLKRRGGDELLKNDDRSSEEDDDTWGNEEEMMEYMRKHGIMSDVSNESLVGHDDDEDEDEDEDKDDVSDKLQGFVNVKEEEILNNTEYDEVETLSPECDWVYVTRD